VGVSAEGPWWTAGECRAAPLGGGLRPGGGGNSRGSRLEGKGILGNIGSQKLKEKLREGTNIPKLDYKITAVSKMIC